MVSSTSVVQTVLIVDDDPQVRDAVRRILESHAFNVITARNGVKAVELARASRDKIDFVVIDVVMPGMTGPEVAGAIHEVHPETEILFMSGHIADPVVARTVGASPKFLRKPFSPGELIERLVTALTMLELAF
jgi:two-component system cell cycle sensor histidine kinase/response regulator CckA